MKPAKTNTINFIENPNWLPIPNTRSHREHLIRNEIKRIYARD